VKQKAGQKPITAGRCGASSHQGAGKFKGKLSNAGIKIESKRQRGKNKGEKGGDPRGEGEVVCSPRLESWENRKEKSEDHSKTSKPAFGRRKTKNLPGVNQGGGRLT